MSSKTTTSLYKTAGFLSENLWGVLSATIHSAVSRFYTRLYETKLSRYFIEPYCEWQYQDRNHHLKFLPGRNKSRYESFQDFFTRDFKEPLKITSEAIWPCEGEVCDYEESISEKLINIKGDLRPIRAIFGDTEGLIP
ncbi:MAG: hypothetical protein IPJ69_08110 [Deltaproteobacteria bacterium]|nr:MAG: hypothetical protein IPJ69_08110 [Deltaproteobacteria bacterium]